MDKIILPYKIKKSIIQKDEIGLFIIAFGYVIRTFIPTCFKEKDIVKIKFNNVGLDCYITPYNKKITNFECFHDNKFEIWVKTISTASYFINRRLFTTSFIKNKILSMFNEHQEYEYIIKQNNKFKQYYRTLKLKSLCTQ